MTESADLLAAIAAAPADDLPRLVFADWLDDRGEPAYAQFIRDQIRLDQVPQWDPLAVRARHQLKDSLGIGRPFFGTLPQLPIFLKWHPEKAFRRGFGSGVVVHQLSGLLEAGPQLFDLAPVEELWLSAATLDEWRQLAKSPWLKNVRKLHFHFSQGLHEPIRCLAESKYAHNIDEIWFDTLETPAAGFVIETLAQSPLAGQLRGLHMRLVNTPSIPETVGCLCNSRLSELKRLSLVQAGLDMLLLRSFIGTAFWSQLSQVDLSYNPLRYWWLHDFSDGMFKSSLMSLKIANCEFQQNPENFTNIYRRHPNIRVMSLSNNPRLSKTNFAEISNSSIPCIEIEGNRIDETVLESISQNEFWNQIIEINLARNRVSTRSISILSESTVSDSLAVLRLSSDRMSKRNIHKLQNHFGDRLVWAADDAPTGLAR